MFDEENIPNENPIDQDGSTEESPEEASERSDDSDAVSRLKSKLDEAYGKQEDLHSKYLRTFADLDNLRKRSIRDRDEAIQRTKKQILEDLLPVIDSFNIGIDTAIKENPDGPLVKGFKMAIDQMDAVLGEYGLICIDAVGQNFDPQFHEAIGYENGESDGIVLKIIRNGYKINGQLLRPASVVVSKVEVKQ
jgi:molecular chaperone GrpE